MTIGTRIRLKREEHNISLTDLAKMISVSKQTLYKYENNIVTNIPSDKIELLSKYLHCTPGFIMGWEEIEYDYDTKSWYYVGKEPENEKVGALSEQEEYLVLQYRDLSEKGKDKVLSYLEFILKSESEDI